MKIERTKNAVRNIYWGVFEKIVGILFPFICRTLLIKTLGAEYLGLNSLFSSVLQVLSLAELGFGSALVFSMYQPIAADDKDTICALLGLYRKVYLVIGTSILAVGLCVTPFITFFVNGGNYPHGINIHVIYLIYLLNTSVSYFLFAYKASLLQAFQRNDVASKINTLITIGQNIAQILTLVLYRNYYIYVMLLPAFSILINLLQAVITSKMFPDYVCRGKVKPALKASIKKKIIGLMSNRIYGVVFTSVDSIVISKFLGLTPLAIYSNYYYVSTAVVGFITVIKTAMVAGVGNSVVVETKKKNYADFQKFVFMNGWVVSWCTTCLFCLYQPFMRLWVGDGLMFPLPTMILMVLLFFIPRVSTMTMTYKEATGLWWEDRFRPIVATIVNLSANLILVQVIGINGVILSTLICSVLINIPWGSYVLFRYYFGRSPKYYYGRLCLYSAATAAATGMTYGVCTFLPGVGWAGLILKAVVCIILPNLLFLFAYIKIPEFQESKALVKQIVAHLSLRFKKK